MDEWFDFALARHEDIYQWMIGSYGMWEQRNQEEPRALEDMSAIVAMVSVFVRILWNRVGKAKFKRYLDNNGAVSLFRLSPRYVVGRGGGGDPGSASFSSTNFPKNSSTIQKNRTIFCEERDHANPPQACRKQKLTSHKQELSCGRRR